MFTTTKGKELATMLLYFRKTFFLKHPNGGATKLWEIIP